MRLFPQILEQRTNCWQSSFFFSREGLGGGVSTTGDGAITAIENTTIPHVSLFPGSAIDTRSLAPTRKTQKTLTERNKARKF